MLNETLVREVQEEIGVTPTSFAKLASFEFPGETKGASELHAFRVDAWTGGNPTIRNNEHVELRWFTVAAACALPNLASNEYCPLFQALEL